MWLVILLAASAALARQAPSFEAASVKAADGRAGQSLRGGPGTNSPGQMSGSATLKTLLMRAYGMKSYQISGPAWMESERYEIAAKIPAGTTKEEAALMLRSLLADRFGLAAHRETKELPIFALVAGKSGPKLKPSAAAGQSGTAGAGAPKLVRGADGLPDIAPGATCRAATRSCSAAPTDWFTSSGRGGKRCNSLPTG